MIYVCKQQFEHGFIFIVSTTILRLTSMKNLTAKQIFEIC